MVRLGFCLTRETTQETPAQGMVELTGIEPVTPCLPDKCSPS